MSEKLFLGIELGSTRIKAVAIDEKFEPVAVGAHNWENRYENQLWTYSYPDIWAGLQSCYQSLADSYEKKFGAKPTTFAGIGISAMMHGYLPLDAQGKELAPFRTWRNTNTGQAAKILSEKFNFNIPLRWSIAHLHQAVLDGESHVQDIALITSLAGYVHFRLTGEKILGVGDASGVFPIADGGAAYNPSMLQAYDSSALSRSLADILPRILKAGEPAGALTEAGAKLLDPTGHLQPGVPFCPPEGDAGTGMVATHSIATRTGNISAGTSIFAMLVLEKSLSARYSEIDMVTTPDGKPVAMVHCNNCATDLDAWVRLFAEAAQHISPQTPIDLARVYEALYTLALQGEADGGGLAAVSYHSGEHSTGFEEGRPLLVRLPEAKFTPANLMRTLLYSAFATLKLGMESLTENEAVQIDKIYGHGGIFTVKGVAQRLLAGALGVPVTVMDTASEGGAWGIALLAAYMGHEAKTLEDFLDGHVFNNQSGSTIHPAQEDVQGFAAYLKRFTASLKIERTAVDVYA
ncbi:MAG: FGGY-family carbohydrate kinase [Defluviitaleaceae bacterium]|nr:FGGY-family carbohydrate kinase [Defluviitaleaceae bacterium]MCL2239320.1 FGGY-family carbohydrate kinase [Defluviitaleaceae bacterium]